MARLFLCLVAAFLTSCAQNRAYTEGMALIEAGELPRGLAKLEQASREDPHRADYRQAYFRQRDLAVQRYLAAAETARLQGDWKGAAATYRAIQTIDPGNPRANAGLQAIALAERQREQLRRAGALLKEGRSYEAETIIRRVLAESPANRDAQQALRDIEEAAIRAALSSPRLPASFQEPIALEFRDATLRQVFEAISRSTNLNFMFDRDVRPDVRTTIFVRDSSIEDVLRFVLVTNQLEKKLLSENTVLIYPNNAAKAREYQDLVMRTFYLTNADAKATATMLKSMVKSKDVHFDEKLNSVVIRDTPEAVRVAERLIATQDLAEPEVMLELEVLEVSSTDLREIGIRWPNSLSVSLVGSDGTPGTVSLREWRERSSDLVRLTVTNPLLAANLRNELGRSNILANPRIRVRNRDKAHIHIGDKVPVVTSTSTATGFVSESVTYLDVGLKLDVEPTVHLDDQVAIKISLEVSNIVREIRSATGTLTYQVGTRNAATTLRLKDGETQILAGLISDEDRKSINQVPGLGDLPALGRLFGSHLDQANKTEIVLLVTPHVVRNIIRPEAQLAEFSSGTEATMGAAPLLLRQGGARTASTAPAALATPVPAFQAGVAGLRLQAPSPVTAGERFAVQVLVDTSAALRRGSLDLAFDPSRLRFVTAAAGSLLSGADKNASLRTNAPEAMGRLNVDFSSNADVKGQGELLVLTFEAVGTAAGSPTIRVDGVSVADANGRAIATAAVPPVTLSLIRK